MVIFTIAIEVGGGEIADAAIRVPGWKKLIVRAEFPTPGAICG